MAHIKKMVLPTGFQFSGTHCGLKPEGNKDLAMIYSEVACEVVGVFTTNLVKAAPVIYDQMIVNGGKPVYAIVANAGNANACTGEQGAADTQAMAKQTAELLGVAPAEVLVLSTGVIGLPLPMAKVREGIKTAAGTLGQDAWLDAAEAIMTTDTRPKFASVHGAEGYTVAGFAKGSGMIAPNMATMLGVLMTDAVLTPEDHARVHGVWQQSFNRIVVDGDMSTNDSVLLLANGVSGILASETPGFFEALQEVSTTLAKAIVQDGEGATKLVQVRVEKAAQKTDAEKIARAIATSPLCKTAFYGADPNWGRFICAAGYAGTDFDPNRATLCLENETEQIKLFDKGEGVAYDESAAIALMQGDAWSVVLSLGLGDEIDWVWTCDLSHEYVTINGHYRT